jgi:hypothetical protein
MSGSTLRATIGVGWVSPEAWFHEQGSCSWTLTAKFVLLATVTFVGTRNANGSTKAGVLILQVLPPALAQAFEFWLSPTAVE